jgi:hypothetical protein
VLLLDYHRHYFHQLPNTDNRLHRHHQTNHHRHRQLQDSLQVFWLHLRLQEFA